MAQEVNLVARTFEIDTVAQASGRDIKEIEANSNDELTLLAGKAAGVCYMPDNYFEDGVQNVEKAMARAEQTSQSGHHSVYDHGHLTFVVKTNKMMAMILNSLGVYATSEKSARYTKMQPETELESQLYEKWRTKIRQLILAKYPDTDDDILSKRLCKKMGIENSKAVINGSCSHIKEDEFLEEELEQLKKSDTLPSAKLAQENARYMISVFTPTTMMYTISFRQMFLTIDYLDKLVKDCDNCVGDFSKKLAKSAKELKEAFEEIAGEKRLTDNKNQNIRFLEYQSIEDKEIAAEGKKENIADSYTLVYNGSLAMLAQAQRHRTLRYSMYLDEPGRFGFYVPEIVKDAGEAVVREWIEDITSVAYCVPQGTVVRITEQGLFEDFVLKCKERMCGRAQLEIMKSTTESVVKFIKNKNNLSSCNKKLLDNITKTKVCGIASVNTLPSTRCEFKDFKCTEGCRWGVNEALSRLI